MFHVCEDDDESDESTSDDNNSPSTSAATKRKRGKQTGTSSTLYKKKKDSMPVPVWTDVPEINSEQPFTAQLEAGVDYILGSPIDYFKDLFDSNILDVIVAESNAFRIQKYSNKPFNISKPVHEQYIATCVYMIIYGLPRSRMYWNNHTRVEKIANVM